MDILQWHCCRSYLSETTLTTTLLRKGMSTYTLSSRRRCFLCYFYYGMSQRGCASAFTIATQILLTRTYPLNEKLMVMKSIWTTYAHANTFLGANICLRNLINRNKIWLIGINKLSLHKIFKINNFNL